MHMRPAPTSVQVKIAIFCLGVFFCYWSLAWHVGGFFTEGLPMSWDVSFPTIIEGYAYWIFSFVSLQQLGFLTGFVVNVALMSCGACCWAPR